MRTSTKRFDLTKYLNNREKETLTLKTFDFDYVYDALDLFCRYIDRFEYTKEREALLERAASIFHAYGQRFFPSDNRNATDTLITRLRSDYNDPPRNKT